MQERLSLLPNLDQNKVTDQEETSSAFYLKYSEISEIFHCYISFLKIGVFNSIFNKQNLFPVLHWKECQYKKSTLDLISSLALPVIEESS